VISPVTFLWNESLPCRVNCGNPDTSAASSCLLPCLSHGRPVDFSRLCFFLATEPMSYALPVVWPPGVLVILETRCKKRSVSWNKNERSQHREILIPENCVCELSENQLPVFRNKNVVRGASLRLRVKAKM